MLIYHGSNRTQDPHELVKYSVVLTTYALAAMEVESAIERLQLYTKKSSQGPLGKVVWFRVVLDEAQCIKNSRTQTARAIWGLRAKRRWYVMSGVGVVVVFVQVALRSCLFSACRAYYVCVCRRCLSGTPIQNSLDDLYSYFKFLRYHPFDTPDGFRRKIKDLIARSPQRGFQALHQILRAIMLRRTKATKIDNQPIVQLPKRVVTHVAVDFSTYERKFYQQVEAESKAKFRALNGDSQKVNMVNVLVCLLRYVTLRQAKQNKLKYSDEWSVVKLPKAT